jgi:large subunit ribosomal protein L6
MKKQLDEKIALLEGITAHIKGNSLTLSGKGKTLSRAFSLPLHTSVTSEGGHLNVVCSSGNKKTWAVIRSFVAHVQNLMRGLQKEFIYELEICNVHFPMTVKVEGQQLVINNFLGEKQKRSAYILPGVSVEIKGTKVLVSSADVEAAGQTAANIEKATHVSKRDRRVFQDGIFITSKDGRAL